MTYVWKMMPWLPYEIDSRVFFGAYDVVNAEQIFNYGFAQNIEYGSEFPVPIFRISKSAPYVDIFSFDGRTYVSQKMKDLLQSFRIEAQFIGAANDSEFSSNMKFYLMNVTSISKLMPRGNVSNISNRKIGSDCEGADIFEFDVFITTDHSGSVFCTDMVASALFEQNIIGLKLVDPEVCDPINFMIIRTQRGIEKEVGWNKVLNIEETELIEEINC